MKKNEKRKSFLWYKEKNSWVQSYLRANIHTCNISFELNFFHHMRWRLLHCQNWNLECQIDMKSSSHGWRTAMQITTIFFVFQYRYQSYNDMHLYFLIAIILVLRLGHKIIPLKKFVLALMKLDSKCFLFPCKKFHHSENRVASLVSTEWLIDWLFVLAFCFLSIE